jgi:hypothetical protein
MIAIKPALNRPSEPPPPMEFLLVHPEGLTAMEVEVRPYFKLLKQPERLMGQ